VCFRPKFAIHGLGVNVKFIVEEFALEYVFAGKFNNVSFINKNDANVTIPTHALN
jgi:hypothetical protein